MSTPPDQSLQAKFEGIIQALFPDGSGEKARLTFKRKKELESFFFAGAACTHSAFMHAGQMNQDDGTKLMADMEAELSAKTGMSKIMDAHLSDKN